MDNKNSVILLIALVAFVVFVSGCMQGDILPDNTNDDDNRESIGGEKDEHGCLIAAGYTWCEAKQKCLREWEESCDDTGDETTDSGSQDLTENVGDGIEEVNQVEDDLSDEELDDLMDEIASVDY